MSVFNHKTALNLQTTQSFKVDVKNMFLSSYRPALQKMLRMRISIHCPVFLLHSELVRAKLGVDEKVEHKLKSNSEVKAFVFFRNRSRF